MATLYTSLTRLKMAMNDGSLPPMTPLTQKALAVLDPASTPGMGALTEDADRGLKCPVIGCDAWRHGLTAHIDSAHPDVGSAGVKRLLEIPPTARLVSLSLSAQRSSSAPRSNVGAIRLRGAGLRQRVAKTARTRKSNAQLMGTRNLRDTCEAQLRHKLIDLQHKIGRSPSENDARAELGEGFVGKVARVYGSWNATKAHFGLQQYSKRTGKSGEYSRQSVLEGLSAYHEAHGTLPRYEHARNPARAPIIPAIPTILKALGTTSWPEAMRRAASLLNIYGGRYGLPESARGAV